MAEYSKPGEGFRFAWGGMRLNSVPDAIPPDHYSAAINVRSTSKNSLKTRPGYVPNFTTGANPVTDIRAYATLGTDDLPRFLARDTVNGIYLDTGSLKVTLGGPTGFGVSMIPFRPSASPQSWMYIAGIGAYQKISAPDGSNAVVVQKVGIAEPNNQLEAAAGAIQFAGFNGTHTDWAAGGTAGSISDGNILTDTAGTVIGDPVFATRVSVQVTSPQYLPGMFAFFAGVPYPVQEVWKACATCTITAIRYDSGTSGLCSVVPSTDISSSIGRGSLVELNSEIVLVLSVTPGTNGTCVFRCSTSGTHAATETITGIPAIVVFGSVVATNAITVPMVQSTIGAGLGTLSRGIGVGMFSPYSPDDYIHVVFQGITATDIINIVFNLSGTTPDYVTSVVTYTISGATLTANLLNPGSLTELHFPISALSDVPGVLNPCNGIEFQITRATSGTVAISGLWVGGGANPDVGDAGAPYMFRAVPRSTLTGAKGNATPDMRYGIDAHRQPIVIDVPSAAYDSQIDVWDFYAKGGTITQYGYVMSAATGSSPITFNYFDDTIAASIAAGNILETDNFEPWPSIAVPWTVASGGGTTITVVGSFITVSGPSSWPSAITSWLPGTLITLSGFQTYTLRSRPVALSGTSYVFEIEESAGSQSPNSISVSEPNVANFGLPYVWGPDAYGTAFAAGDPQRPGTQYFSKSYALDSAPQQNTLEVTTPDQPILGGIIKSGVSIAAGTNRWWAYYPNLSGSSYYAVEWAVGSSPVSPYGMDTDGNWVYYWARDGIHRTSGAGFESLTDDDFYNLFPHEGVQGVNVNRYGVTFYAPDYSRAAMFRLAWFNNFLYALYQDSTATYRMMVYDISAKGWTADQYGQAMSAIFGIKQQASGLTGGPALYPALIYGGTNGHVYTQQDLHNDDAAPITGNVQTFEFSGGDIRAFEQWGDLYLDATPVSAITVSPLSGSALAAPASTVAASTSRTFQPISLGGEIQVDFLGMGLSWTDDFTKVTTQTVLHAWQPSWVSRPELIIDRVSDWIGSFSG